MEFVILGLLMIRDLSQYDIRGILQRKISPFFSPSLGSIQAALKKLEGNNHVTSQEIVDNGRRKRIYAISISGKQYFLDWMLSSIVPNRLEQDMTTRLFFLGFMNPSERVTIIHSVIIQLHTTVQEFEAALIEANQKEVPEHLKQVVTYQMKTLDLGLYYHRSMLEWFESLIREEVDVNDR